MEPIVYTGAEVRQRYRKLLHEIEDMQEELANIENYQLMGYMMDSQDLFAHVGGPQEAEIDAKVMKLLAKLVRLQAEQMSTNIRQFTYKEYGERLLAKMHVENEQKVTRMKMIRLGEQVKYAFRRSPPLTFLYGSVDTAPAQVKVKEHKDQPTKSRRACRERDLVETISSEVSVMKRSENQTEELVCQVYKRLVERYLVERLPIDYFRFVIDPDSFGCSIENMFHISFLVKEGKVAIFVSKETGLPMIRPISTSSQSNEMQPEDNSQVVMNMCMADWARMVDTLGIRKPMIRKEGHC